MSEHPSPDRLRRTRELVRHAFGETAWGWPVLAAALALVGYWPALHAGWVWDDDQYVTQNSFVQAWDGLREIWLTIDTPQYYPLVFTTFWIEHKLWGLDPTGYHVVNLALHLANALLVWRLALTLRLPAAWFIAAVFALHPVHVESVAWITERKNVLSALFYLLAFLAYLRFDDTARWRWYAAAVALFVAAMLSKTVTVTLPVTLVLALVWRRSLAPRELAASGATSWPRCLVAWLPRCLVLRHALALVPMILAGAALGLTTAYLERYSVGAEGAEWNLPFLQRLLILAPSAFCFYASKIAWPHPLIFIYPRWEIAAGNWHWWLPALALLTVLALLIRAIRRFGWGPFLLVLFSAVSLFPALGFFNVYPFRYSYIADHFQYLGSLGFITLYVALACRLSGRLVPQRWRVPVGVISAVALAGIFSGLTHRQARSYRDAETLWRTTLEANPQAAIAMINLAGFHWQAGRYEQAAELINRAKQYPRAAPELYGFLANLAYQHGRYEVAAQHYRAFIALRPRDPRGYRGLRLALSQLGRLDEAADCFERALQDESLARTWRGWNLGHLWFELAQVRYTQGRFEQAADCAARAVAADPQREDARLLKERALLRLQRR